MRFKPLFITAVLIATIGAIPLLAAAVTVTVTSPANNAVVNSPVLVAANATSSRRITGWKIYVDGTSVYQTGQTRAISASISIAAGSHVITVRAWNSKGEYGSATVNVTAQTSTPVSVSINPTTATVASGKAYQFSAAVSGATNTGVAWQVNGTTGGNPTGGTITSTGLYTAPSVTTNVGVTVTARSVADPTKSSSASVTVTAPAPPPVSISISPTSATVASGKTYQFSAAVSGTTNTVVTWEVNGIQGGSSTTGTITSSGLYTAPPVTSSLGATVTARSAYDTTRTSSASVTVMPQSVGTSTLTINTLGRGAGVVTADSGGINCPGTCSAAVTTGSVITLTASPSGGSQVGNWSAICSGGASTCSVAVNANTQISVNFDPVSGSYYVSPSGSDSNIGSPSLPWKTIQHAIDSAKLDPTYGATIHVAPGTYPASVSASALTPACPSNSVAFCVNKSGISDSIRLAVQCDAQYFGCRVTGGATAMAEFANSGYADIIGFEYGDMPNALSAVIGYSGTGNRVIHNYFHDVAQTNNGGCPQEGMIVASGSMYGLVVRDNIIRHYADNTLTSCQHAHGIYVSYGAIIENNIVSATPGLGIQFGPSMCKGVISNNTVFANRGGGILVDDAPGSSCTVNGNMTVNNNIVFNNGDGWGYYGISDSYRTQAPIYNSYRNNLLYGNYPSDSVRATTGGGTISGNVTSESPSVTFVNYLADGTGNYHLKAGSVAIQGGTTSCTPNGVTPCTPAADMSGKTRPTPPSIGAYEY